MLRRSIVGAALLAACTLFAAAIHAQPAALYQGTMYKGREIGKLTGDVYYARSDDYVSAFMVTSEGIILVEPIGTEFASWLKGELERRFLALAKSTGTVWRRDRAASLILLHSPGRRTGQEGGTYWSHQLWFADGLPASVSTHPAFKT